MAPKVPRAKSTNKNHRQKAPLDESSSVGSLQKKLRILKHLNQVQTKNNDRISENIRLNAIDIEGKRSLCTLVFENISYAQCGVIHVYQQTCKWAIEYGQIDSNDNLITNMTPRFQQLAKENNVEISSSGKCQESTLALEFSEKHDNPTENVKNTSTAATQDFVADEDLV